MKNRFACLLWQRIYRRWLRDDERVIAVLGWRTMRTINDFQGIACVTPIFWGFK